VKHPNFDLTYSILCFSRIVFDEFIVKGGRLCTKLVELFANRVKRRNMIMSIGASELALRVLRGVISGGALSFSCLLFAILFDLPLFVSFVGLMIFPSSRWPFELFLGFWSSSCASCVLDSKFKLCAFCFYTHQRERLRNQVVNSLVWLWWVIDLPRFEFESGRFRWFYLYLSCVENRVCLSCSMQVTGVT
jgi:hypothetical protein